MPQGPARHRQWPPGHRVQELPAIQEHGTFPACSRRVHPKVPATPTDRWPAEKHWGRTRAGCVFQEQLR